MSSGTDSRQRILDVAEQLVTAGGFNAFSYRDIAVAVGVRNASIHYHFPSKTDLGVALIERHIDQLKGSNAALLASGLDAPDKLERAFDVARRITGGGRHICLLGILQAEYESYPEPMRVVARELGRYHRRVVTDILTQGRESGQLRFEGSVQAYATLVITAVQGSLQLARALGDPSVLETTLDTLWRVLGATPKPRKRTKGGSARTRARAADE